MGHPTVYGLRQENGAVTNLATSCLKDLEGRGVTADRLTHYGALTQAMVAADAASGSETSDKEQLTAGEQTAKAELLGDVRRVQGGFKRAFPKGSPQWKEALIGVMFNHSTGMLVVWADNLAIAWLKYKDTLIKDGNLVQADIDEMAANAAVLKNVDSKQETAKHADVPDATLAKSQAMDAVEAEADFIYGAATAEYAKNPQMLGKFEALKPLRYSIDKTPKKEVAATTTKASASPGASPDTAKK